MKCVHVGSYVDARGKPSGVSFSLLPFYGFEELNSGQQVYVANAFHPLSYLASLAGSISNNANAGFH